jgi:hypothetical protein
MGVYIGNYVNTRWPYKDSLYFSSSYVLTLQFCLFRSSHYQMGAEGILRLRLPRNVYLGNILTRKVEYPKVNKFVFNLSRSRNPENTGMRYVDPAFLISS